MKKTLLLCFIHGFKGGDDTFATFPAHLKAVLQLALPKIEIAAIAYPRFETRGDLRECVGRFREWLQNKVIDLEVANGTASPTVDPSVHTILVGHSMGGIMAAEALLAVINEQPVSSLQNSMTGSASESRSTISETSSLMFPYIQGILAFDTPYLGIAPGVVAHGAEKHWNAASSAYSAYNSLADAFGWGGKGAYGGGSNAVDTSKMLPAPTAVSDSNADAAAAPLWQRYGRVALFAGAAGAVAAGGAAAYMKREQITEGFTWATSHLEFVGCLARPEEMKKRLASIVRLSQEHDIGFATIFTTLGRAVDRAQQDKAAWTGKVSGIDRTFCNLPKGELRNYFIPAINDKSEAETWAHMTMFSPKDNPGYYSMSEHAKEKILEWMEGPWYDESEGPGSMEGIVFDLEEEVAEEGEGEMVEPVEEEFENVGRPSVDVRMDETVSAWQDEGKKVTK